MAPADSLVPGRQRASAARDPNSVDMHCYGLLLGLFVTLPPPWTTLSAAAAARQHHERTASHPPLGLLVPRHWRHQPLGRVVKRLQTTGNSRAAAERACCGTGQRAAWWRVERSTGSRGRERRGGTCGRGAGPTSLVGGPMHRGGVPARRFVWCGRRGKVPQEPVWEPGWDAKFEAGLCAPCCSTPR